MATIFATRVAVSARPLTRASSSAEEKVRTSPPPSRVARVSRPSCYLGTPSKSPPRDARR
jgi:hypothetical protein